MKWALYNVAFALVFPFLLPGFLLRMLRRGGYAARMGDRFALYPGDVLARLRERRPVWVHAVSVGEVQVALQLMEEWRRAEPDVSFCFSTTSSTGWKIASRGVGVRDTLIYNPLDFPSFVKSAFESVRPRAVVLTESEIWPVFIRRARKTGVPVYLVNARVSDRSAPRYARAKWFFQDVFGCFSRIFAQSALDARRLAAAGAPESIIETTGSFKFDVARRNEAKERELLAWLDGACAPAAAGARRILLGASTWPGEDKVLLDIYKTLPEDVVLVLAPRHFEKADAVEANILGAGFSCVRRSRGAPADGAARSGRADARTVFLADTTGELMGLYGIADAAFVGKSLCEHGSQNMIEPCLCGKPTVVGPYTENFRPVMSDLLESDAIVQVKDAGELGRTIARWFSPEGREEALALGARASAAVAARRGVVPKCVAEIRASIAAGDGGGSQEPCRASAIRKVLRAAMWLAAGAALAAALWFAPGRRASSSAISPGDGDEFRFPALKTISAYLPLVEKPDARRAYFADAGIAEASEILARAGLVCCSNNAPGRFDLVLVSDASRRKWGDVSAKVAENGVLAWVLDVRRMTMATFRSALESFPCEDAHFWMPGEDLWVLTGRLNPRKVKLSAMLEALGNENTFDDLVAARCYTVPEFFASYAGDRSTAVGAFAGDPAAEVRPEFFVTREIPDIDWIVAGDTDEDILAATAQEVRSMQVVRRVVLEGNMLAREGNGDAAMEKWAAAMLRNPHDTMLLERLHRLAVNARTFRQVGNIKAAAKCYETMICVRPKDVAAIVEYATCLRMLGKKDLAAEVMERAEQLGKEIGNEEFQ